jgi:threonine synthase
MLAAVRDTGGEALTVEDEALPPVLREFAGKGILMEPTSGVPFAGAEALLRAGKLEAGETVVIPVTGHGLKAADKLGKLLGEGH